MLLLFHKQYDPYYETYQKSTGSFSQHDHYLVERMKKLFL